VTLFTTKMTEEDGIGQKGLDVIERIMMSMKNDILEKMDERSKKQKEEIIVKIEENSKIQSETLAEIANKNTEQDKRLDELEATNSILTKRIEELEKTKAKTWANIANTPYIPNSSTNNTPNTSRKESNKNDNTKESTKSENNTIQHILEQASKIVGLQPIDEQDIARNTWEGDNESEGISNAVSEFLKDELKYSDKEIKEMGITNIKK